MKHRRYHHPGHPTSTKGRLSRRREVLVYVVLGTLWASGAGWLIFHYFLHQASEFGELPHPLEAWWLRLHGAAAFAALWLLGLLWAVHLVPAWNARRRSSGIVLSAITAMLAVSGYLIYYVGAESARAWIVLAHWLLGLAVIVPLLLHALRGRHVGGATRER